MRKLASREIIVNPDGVIIGKGWAELGHLADIPHKDPIVQKMLEAMDAAHERLGTGFDPTKPRHWRFLWLTFYELCRAENIKVTLRDVAEAAGYTYPYLRKQYRIFAEDEK